MDIMTNEKKVSLTISITKAIRDRLRTMAVEQNLQDPDRLTSASTIAREIIADHLEQADKGQEKTTKGGQPQ
jgi:hypothetical protein